MSNLSQIEQRRIFVCSPITTGVLRVIKRRGRGRGAIRANTECNKMVDQVR